MATYTVKQGDNLVSLAKRLGVSTSSLLAANPGVSAITAGVTLRIPTPTTTSDYTPPPPEGGYGPRGYKGPLKPPPYVPPPPEGGYGPRGYPKKPGTQLPYGERPPPYVPPPTQPPVSPRPPVSAGRLAPPPVPVPQPPPVHYTQQLEREPVVSLTGAQQAPPPWQVQPGSFQSRTMDYINRLFAVQPQRRDDRSTFGRGQPVVSVTGAQRPEVPWYAPQPGGFQERAYNLALDPTQENLQGVIQAAGAGLQGLGERFGIPDTSENAINQATAAREQGQERGVHWYRMLMGDGREDRMFAYVWNEDTPQEELLKQRAGHVADSLNRDDYPQVILESDRRLMKYSEEDMDELGYVWDEEKQHWIWGGMIEEPQTYGAASLPGWGYNYPPRRGGGGGGGGGSYSYPSYLPREQAPYPQSFVGREQPGGIPQLAQTRAARFGAITWRI